MEKSGILFTWDDRTLVKLMETVVRDGAAASVVFSAKSREVKAGECPNGHEQPAGLDGQHCAECGTELAHSASVVHICSAEGCGRRARNDRFVAVGDTFFPICGACGFAVFAAAHLVRGTVKDEERRSALLETFRVYDRNGVLLTQEQATPEMLRAEGRRPVTYTWDARTCSLVMEVVVRSRRLLSGVFAAKSRSVTAGMCPAGHDIPAGVTVKFCPTCGARVADRDRKVSICSTNGCGRPVREDTCRYLVVDHGEGLVRLPVCGPCSFGVLAANHLVQGLVRGENRAKSLGRLFRTFTGEEADQRIKAICDQAEDGPAGGESEGGDEASPPDFRHEDVSDNGFEDDGTPKADSSSAAG